MILVICNLGFGGELLGGQFVRSRNVSEYIKNNSLESVEVLDISTFSWLSFGRILVHFIRSTQVVIMPGPNLLALLSRFRCMFFGKNVHLVAIGGWLDQSADQKSVYKFLKSCHSIWVQTLGLKDSLQRQGLTTDILPNFTNASERFHPSPDHLKKLKIVYCSRVSIEKGIVEAIDAISALDPNKFCLDIYGPIQGVDLESYIVRQPHIAYKGVLDPVLVHKALAKYHVMLFPTYYEGEGFPGVLIDSFVSGLCVITTKWKYNSEIIVDGENGILVNIKNSEDIRLSLLSLYCDQVALYNYRLNSFNSGERYCADTVMEKFIGTLNEEATEQT